MFTRAEFQKESFLEQTKAAREERAMEKKRENAVILIQSQLRGYIERKKYYKRVMYVIEICSLKYFKTLKLSKRLNFIILETISKIYFQ